MGKPLNLPVVVGEALPPRSGRIHGRRRDLRAVHHRSLRGLRRGRAAHHCSVGLNGGAAQFWKKGLVEAMMNG